MNDVSRPVTVFIAMSLDGYVADTNGGVGWHSRDASAPDNFGSYLRFTRPSTRS